MGLQILAVTEETATDWREIHNHVIPVAPVSVEDVIGRLSRHLLTLAYDDGVLVANATLRPPSPRSTTAIVIVRVPQPLRRRGYGSEYLRVLLDEANRTGAKRIETVVLAANTDGLEFAQRRGFVECDRYRLGDRVEYVTMALG